MRNDHDFVAEWIQCISKPNKYKIVINLNHLRDLKICYKEL